MECLTMPLTRYGRAQKQRGINLFFYSTERGALYPDLAMMLYFTGLPFCP